MSAGSGSVSAGFGPPGTCPCSVGFPSGPPPTPAGTSEPDETNQFKDLCM